MDFQNDFQESGRHGGEVNVNVSADQFTISGSVLSEFAPGLIKIISDIAMNPAFLHRSWNDSRKI